MPSVKMEIELTTESDSLSLIEEVVQIKVVPDQYRIVKLDPELEEEEEKLCHVIGEIGSTDEPETITGDIEETENINISDISNFTETLSSLNNDINYPLICRLCATRGNDMINIFGRNKKYKDIIKMIDQCLTIVVKKSDSLPKQACRSCLDRLELCYQFHKTVAEAEKQLLILRGKIINNTKKKENYCQALKLQCDGQRDLTGLDGNQEIIKTVITEEFHNMEKTEEEEDDIDPLDLERISKSEDCSEKELKDSVEIVDQKYENDIILIREKGGEDETSTGQKADCKLIKCRICGKAFQTVRKCYIHSSVHASKNDYPCGICDKTFPNEKECNVHSAEHIESKKYERRVATNVCKECGKRFVTQARLEFHQIYHNSNSKPCYCEKCNKMMASEASLYQHMLSVHKQYKQYCCDICGNQFRAQSQLYAHQRKHKDERPFECTICNKRFYSNDILRRHKKLHLPEKPYQCNQCGKRFDRNNTLTKHLLKHQVEAGGSTICQVCNICKEVFASDVAAEIHLKNCTIITEDNEDNKILKLNLKETYRCEYCERCYTEIEYMKNHRSCHSKPSPYICTVCDTAYATYNQVTAHKTAHKRTSKISAVKDELVIPRYFTCDYCDKSFLHFTKMNIHRRSCSAGKIWNCGYCRAVFENARELSRHKTGEANDEIWPCNECNNSFGSECAFEIHKETHSTLLMDKKNFSCLYCQKTFNRKAHLTVHLRSHTGERPYSCDLCDKAYKIKTERDNHRRTHSGEKPFKCSLCDKTFANTVRLREHTRFHSGKRPYPCSLCNQSFKKANARNVHMTIHTGEKPYQCDICGMNFRLGGDMRKHKRTQHGQKKATTKNDTSFEIDSKISNAL